jgi:hypothetical protein
VIEKFQENARRPACTFKWAVAVPAGTAQNC